MNDQTNDDHPADNYDHLDRAGLIEELIRAKAEERRSQTMIKASVAVLTMHRA